MGLPWVRLDTNIATNDKILCLLSVRGGRAAAFCYVCSLAFAGGQGTDGIVPFVALPVIHATKRDAELLVEHGLWDTHPQGWKIRNFTERQQMAAVAKSIRAAQRQGALKANCVRWHGAGCGCWEARS